MKPWPEIMEETAQHYAELSRVPGWLDYCRQQVRDMEAETHGEWRGLLGLVRDKLKTDSTEKS